ncbi:hypothetical protein B6264_00640 [Kitasatospora aureofaciens]|nr:hypothetical protein B6264_00640 [Kitasatospora aureofaciens]QEU98780.1 ABC transporter ATP-binding protein [Streptomyces viridifaciens]
MAVLGLHDPRTTTVSGSIRLDGQELVGAGEPLLRGVRGGRAALVLQDALTSLSPFHGVGAQLAETYRLHHPRAGRAEARRRAAEMLDRVGIPSARLRDHPHRFSGGTRQRVVIAMALMNEPRLLIADEPTTALDARVQRQVLDLPGELQCEHGTAVLLVSHDLGVVAGTTDRTLVLRDGSEVESAPTGELLAAPRAPYTRALVGAALRTDSVPGSGRGALIAAPGRRCSPFVRLRGRGSTR